MDEKIRNKKINNLKKSILTAYILWAFCGFFGIHRFYLGKNWTGFIYLLTGGFFVVGWLVDLLLIPNIVSEYNDTIDLDYSK
jgi:TM2 domain-containing membrane protein YozV